MLRPDGTQSAVRVIGKHERADAYVNDPLGTQRYYSYSGIGGVAKFSANNTPCPTCADDSHSVGYDSNGNVSLKTDFNGNQTRYGFDLTRNLETSRTEAYGSARARTITTSWDPTFRQPATITEPNRSTSFSYDTLGNVLTKTITDTTVTPNVSRVWTYTYDSYGRALTVDGPRTDVSDVTTYTYYTCATGYQCGQVQTITDALGHVTTYSTYNAHGQPLTITDPNGILTTLTYDARQRVTSRQFGTETTGYAYYPTGLLQKVTQPDGSYLQYTYDGAHRLTKIQDSLGNSISYTLDAMGNRTAESTYDPSNTLATTRSRVYNSLNQLYQEIASAGTAAVATTFGYDANGNQTSIAAPLSRNTSNAYDELNRLKQITDPASGITQFGYDRDDNLTSVTDPRSLLTSYTYNGFGDLVTQVSPDTGTTANTYDSAGNLKTTTDARGAVGTYSYDALNRVLAVQFVKAGLTTVKKGFIYDNCTYGKGRLCERDDAVGITKWTYTAQGRIASRTETDGSSPNLAVPPPGLGQYVINYGYNGSGQRTSLQMPSGSTVNYSYNTNGQASGVSVTVAGVTTSILSNVIYEPFGAVRSWTWGNGATAIRSHDQDGHASVVSSTGLHESFQYDTAQRLWKVNDLDNATLNWSYGLDSLDRLTSGNDASQSLGWSYDANGNRLTQTGTTAHTYSYYSASNQILRRDLENSDELYDAAGNPQTYNGEVINFDAEGNEDYYGELLYTNGARQRITAYAATTTSPDRLVFDDEGHFLGKYQVDSSAYPTLNLIAEEETIYLGDTPVAVLIGQASYNSNGDYLGTQQTPYYVHADHLNTPRRLTRPADNVVVWRWDSDPFGNGYPNGNPAGGSAWVTYSARFPGQVYDLFSGWYYNYFRDYDPAAGRYVESDPIGLAGGSYSTYTYAGNNPLSFVDPLGLAASCGVPDRCAQLRKQIFTKSALLIRELRKYNPIEDARGGFQTGGGGFSVPGGHYTKIQNLQRGLKNDISEYKRLCSDNGGWPPVPRSLDEAANRDVPVPIITPEPDISPGVPDSNQSLVAPSGGLLGILLLLGAFAF